MIKKLFAIFIVIFIIFAVIYFFLFNDSYKKSLQARVYYSLGEYQKAYVLANEAYLGDPYNRMALTILNASKASLRYKKYIKDAQMYLKKIKEISSKKSISKAQMAKIKLICEVMMGQYKTLKPIVVKNEELVKKTTQEYKKFKKIYDELFKK